MADHYPAAYRRLVLRLNQNPQGAPPSPLLFDILKHLFSEREARLVALLPIKAFTAETAAGIWNMTLSETRDSLAALCRRALLIDIEQKGRMLYCLPPPMAGFFEFSLMHRREDIDQRALAGLFYRYINLEEDFAGALFADGQTRLGRVFVDETRLARSGPAPVAVLPHESASQVVRTAARIGVSLCYCRRKMSYVNRACKAPLDICMTFGLVADSLIRHGHARRVEAAEALELLDRSRELNLVQFGENVREQVNFICNCCKCCCEGMVAARRFAASHAVASSNFLAVVEAGACRGCALCAAACPVDAIRCPPRGRGGNGAAGGAPAAVVDTSVCLGCGVCARVCPAGAVRLQPRPQRVITPLNTAHRVILMALERGRLQEVLFDNQVLYSHRALALLLGAILRLPPVKQALAGRQLKSRYLESMVRRMRWQPPDPAG